MLFNKEGKLLNNLKSNLIKGVVIFMAISSIFGMSGCQEYLNRTTADKVCNALSEKYGESFTALSIGDRWYTNHSKLIIHPTDNDELLFTATLQDKTNELEDDYPIQRVTYSLKKQVESSLSELGYEAVCNCVVIESDLYKAEKIENKEYSPESLINDGLIDDYFSRIIVNSPDCDVEKIANAVSEISKKENIIHVCGLYLIEESSDFEVCKQELKHYTDYTDSMIKEHNPISIYAINTEYDKYNWFESK